MGATSVVNVTALSASSACTGAAIARTAPMEKRRSISFLLADPLTQICLTHFQAKRVIFQPIRYNLLSPRLMRAFLVVFGLCLGGAACTTPVLYAQGQTEIPDQTQPPEQTEAPPQPPAIGPVHATDLAVHPDDTHLDLTDLWRKIRHKDQPGQPPPAVGAGDRRFLVFA